MYSKVFAQAREDTPVPSATLTRRPDVALFNVEASVDDLGAAASLQVLRGAFRRLAAELPGPATLRTLDADMPSMAALIGKSEATAAVLRGQVNLPLAVEQDLDGRLTAMAAVDDVLRAWLLEARKSKPAWSARRAQPVCVLSPATLEACRMELLQQWQGRLKELEALGRVEVKDVNAMAAVIQRAVGPDEVQVSLDMGGRVTVTLKGG